MARIYGLQGYLTGKLGSTVFAIRNGEQVARQYNPVVSNPKSEAQLQNRAKLKLLSQLSAALSPVIAMPRIGAVSSRNRFTAQNYEYTTYGNDAASIPMGDILLTASYTGFPGLSVVRSNGALNVTLLESAATMWDKVVYVVIRKMDTGAIAPASSQVISVAGSNGLFPAALTDVDGDCAVLAYGIRLNTQESRVRFGNIVAPSAEDVAKIVTSRSYNENDMSLSETRGLYLAANATSGQTEGQSRVNINAIAYDGSNLAEGVGGTITGAGRYDLNSTFTLVANAAANYRFVGWKTSLGGSVISTNATYTGTADGSKTLYAEFESTIANVVLNVLDQTTGNTGVGGSVTGAGAYTIGDSVTVVATPAEDKEFVGWRNAAGMIVSTAVSYTFTASSNVTLTAVFRTPIQQHTVTVGYAAGSNSGMGSVSGGGTFEDGESVTVVATPTGSYIFSGWFDNQAGTGEVVSLSSSYTFTPSANVSLYARFAADND